MSRLRGIKYIQIRNVTFIGVLCLFLSSHLNQVYCADSKDPESSKKLAIQSPEPSAAPLTVRDPLATSSSGPTAKPSPGASGYVQGPVKDTKAGKAGNAAIDVNQKKTAQLISIPVNKTKIMALTFTDMDELPMSFSGFGVDMKGTVKVRGKYSRPDWALMNRKLRIKLDKNKNFAFDVPLEGKLTTLELTAIGPLGEIENERFSVVVKDFQEAKMIAAKAPAKRYSIIPGLGLTWIHYKQGKKTDFNELAATVKVAISYLIFPPYWDFGFNIYGTAYPIMSTDSEKSAWFLGANLRFGLVMPFIKDPWRVSLLAGISYSSVFGVPSDKLGYQHLTWPQIYPTIRRVFKNNDSIYAYFKYATIADGISLSLSEREFASGIGYIHILKIGHPLSISFDWSDMRVTLTSGTTSQAIVSSSYSLGVGFGW